MFCVSTSRRSNLNLRQVESSSSRYVVEKITYNTVQKITIFEYTQVSNPDFAIKLASSSFSSNELTSFFRYLSDGDLRMGLTMCGRSICLPFSSNRGILFGDKNDLFLLGEADSRSDVRVDLVLNND